MTRHRPLGPGRRNALALVDGVTTTSVILPDIRWAGL